jgi:hypothetical protein
VVTIVMTQVAYPVQIKAMINISEKSSLKRKMLEVCIDKQQSLIDDFKIRIKTLLETDGLGNEEAYDNNQQANTSQQTAEVNSLSHALEFANREMETLLFLRSMRSTSYELPAPGAVVVTNLNTFFISVSVEQFQINGETYVGLSIQSPLFLAMQTKRKGEKFSFKGITYKINDIY